MPSSNMILTLPFSEYFDGYLESDSLKDDVLTFLNASEPYGVLIRLAAFLCNNNLD